MKKLNKRGVKSVAVFWLIVLCVWSLVSWNPVWLRPLAAVLGIMILVFLISFCVYEYTLDWINRR